MPPWPSRSRVASSLAEAARLTGVGLIDCGPERGASVLLASGSGLMMAVLDQCPELGWCAELDRGGHALDFALLAQRHVRAIALCGWFSLTSPAAFRAIAAARLTCPVLSYGGNVQLGCSTLEEFLRACQCLDELPLPEVGGRAPLSWTVPCARD